MSNKGGLSNKEAAQICIVCGKRFLANQHLVCDVSDFDDLFWQLASRVNQEIKPLHFFKSLVVQLDASKFYYLGLVLEWHKARKHQPCGFITECVLLYGDL